MITREPIAFSELATRQGRTGVVYVDDTLTVANSATQGIGIFRIVFSSATAAVLFRLG